MYPLLAYQEIGFKTVVFNAIAIPLPFFLSLLNKSIFANDQSAETNGCKYIKITANALAKYMNTIESYVS